MASAQRIRRVKADDLGDEDRPVRVIVRLRPALDPGEADNYVKVDSDLRTVTLNDLPTIEFDGCYGETSNQQEIFEHEVQPILHKVFQGHNACIFAYGVTGSGKSHTMVGNSELQGMIPRAVKYILDKKSEKSNNFEVRFQFCQIISEKIYDLLEQNSKALNLRCNSRKEVLIPDLSERVFNSFHEFTELFTAGCSNRKTASTKLNTTSSRSHAIVTVKIYNRASNGLLTSHKLHLVDLAGSEDNRKTGNIGERLTESNAINSDLFAFSNVVSAINSKQVEIDWLVVLTTSDLSIRRIYRIEWAVLEDSLGGTGLAIMICNISPGLRDQSSTKKTLKLGKKLRNCERPFQYVTQPQMLSENIPPHSPGASTDDRQAKPEDFEGQCNQRLTNATRVKDPPSDRRDLKEENANDLVKVDFVESVETYAESSKKRLASEFITKAQSCREKGLLRDALILVKHAESLFPDNIVAEPVKTGLARDYIIEAKNLKEQGLIEKSLQVYRHAQLLCPANQKLATKIECLEKTLKETGSSSNPLKSFDEKRFVTVMNEGTSRDLCQFHLIGKATAKAIIELRATREFMTVLHGILTVNPVY